MLIKEYNLDLEDVEIVDLYEDETSALKEKFAEIIASAVRQVESDGKVDLSNIKIVKNKSNFIEC